MHRQITFRKWQLSEMYRKHASDRTGDCSSPADKLSYRFIVGTVSTVEAVVVYGTPTGRVVGGH